jgi:hypothetical protein
MKKIILPILITISSFVALPTHAAEGVQVIPQVTDGWRASVTPYLWMVNVGGSATYDQTKLGSVDYNARDILANLNFAGMVSAEVHNGHLGAMADVVFSKISTQSSYVQGVIDIGSKTSVEQGIYTVAATYTLNRTDNLYIDGLAGVRVMNVVARTELNVADGPFGASKSIATTSTTPIAGVKGRARISDSDYFVPFYFDVGGMGQATEVTTQQMIGFGRAYEWGDATIAFKNLYYRQRADGFTTNQRLFGLAAGLTFKF